MNEDLLKIRHSASHVLATAVLRLFPDAKLDIGPATENGFYYDFDLEHKFTSEDLAKIEAEMKKIISENQKFERIELDRAAAEKAIRDSGQEEFKLGRLADIPEGEKITMYRNGEFCDLCAGPHLTSTGKIKAFKLTSLTGAYWKGNEKNKMLTRIYGTCFEKKSDLDEYIQKLEDAKMRDHNKVGRELGLFMTDENIGQGLPLMMPKGARIIQIMERFVEDEEQKRGYLLTKTPIMTKNNLFIVSGHWDHYKDKMFYIGDEDVDDEILCLRPMTCPLQFTIYKNGLKSYRDLPIRYAETAIEFRKEASGEMHGLIRVRQFTISEGHYILRPEQLEDEFRNCLELAKYCLDTVGLLEDCTFRFSQWDPANPNNKYEGTAEQWNEAQEIMGRILDDLGVKYTVGIDEAAFYGPKLDIQYKNVFGKEDTLVTIQIDMLLAERFGMEYTDQNGQKVRPYIIHRTSLGCYERTLAYLIEKYAGALPLWMMPTQVRVLPITDRAHDYAQEIVDRLRDAGIRAESDYRSEKLGYKIREAQMQKIPYMLVVGDRDMENQTVSVRTRAGVDLGAMSVDDFRTKCRAEIDTKVRD